MKNTEKTESLNFIEEIIEEHNRTGRFDNRVHTRFPPEPNGFLHIGHAKAICVNFGIAQKYGGKTNLRFDDTNPTTEKTDYVEAIKRDIKWLGFDWEEREYFASDYFQQLYEYAVQLIQQGDAYVDFSSAEEMDRMKKMGEESQYRDTRPEENLRIFEQMKNGEIEEGTCVLRAKINMQDPNRLLRDPVIYRVKKAHHHRTGDDWCIYPMYDWAHGQSDSIEGITHSLCSLEFEVHRPLYDWCQEKLGIYRSQQIEFSRLNLGYTITSKRKLLQLIEGGYVNGWDDPRMPTLSGLRRRGYTPASIRNFIDKAGVSKRSQQIDIALLESCLKEDLNKVSHRVMAVLDPVKVIITNYPEGATELLDIVNNPEDESAGIRQVPFGREIYIERDDFMLDPPKKYFRLAPNKTVRLKGAYIIECEDYKTDENGQITEIYCKYYESSKSGQDTSGIKVKGTLHWVSVLHAVEAEVRLYDRLFNDENPAGHKDENGEAVDFKQFINPKSLETITAYVEPVLKDADLKTNYQFMRKGYFYLDEDAKDGKLIFNRTVTLRDNWSKKEKGKQQKQGQQRKKK